MVLRLSGRKMLPTYTSHLRRQINYQIQTFFRYIRYFDQKSFSQYKRYMNDLKTFIRIVIMYSRTVWNFANANFNKLQIIQNRYLRCIPNLPELYYRTTDMYKT